MTVTRSINVPYELMKAVIKTAEKEDISPNMAIKEGMKLWLSAHGEPTPQEAVQ